MKNIIAGIIFLTIGVGTMFLGYSWYKDAKATNKWPTVEGVVLSAEVTTHDSDGTTMYKPVITYKYSVGGKEYSCPKVSFSDYSSSNSDYAYETVNKYPKGTKVTVFYNPQKPYKAILEPGVGFFTYLPLGLGAVFSLIGFLLLLKPVLKIIFLIFAT
jgi:hypothetical protein